MDNQFNTHLEKGNEHRNKGLYEQALEEFQKAAACAENNKQKLTALLGVANILNYSLKRNEDALVVFEQCFELATENNEKNIIKNNIGSILSALDRNEEAITAFKSAFAFATDNLQRYTSTFNEAFVLSKMKRHNESLILLEQCAHYATSNDEKQNLRFQIITELFRLEKFNLAINVCKQILNDTNSTHQQKYDAQFNIGLIRDKENKYIESKEAFKKSFLLAINKTDKVQSKFNEARILIEQYQFKEALNELAWLDDYISEHELNDFNYLIKFQIGSVLACDKQYDEAIKKLHESLKYASSDEEKYNIYQNIGHIYVRLKKYNDAISSFKSTLAIDLDDEKKCWQLLNISNTEILQGSYQQALLRIDEMENLNKADEQNFYYLFNKGWLSAKLDCPFSDTLKLFNDALKCKQNFSQMNLIDFLLQIQKIEIKKDKENSYTSTNLIEIIKEDYLYHAVMKEHNIIEYQEDFKEFYFQVCKIIALLSVTHRMEYKLAHYTSIDTAQKLLGPTGKFRLSSIAHVNDPSEGKSLLSYFKQKNWKSIFHPYLKQQAFVSCFSFNHNHLNQFRLYGNNQGKIATGLSLVFERDQYFNQNNFNSFQELSYNTIKNNVTNYSKSEQSETLQPPESTNKQGNNKLVRLKPQIAQHLFRCIYIDPKPHKADTTFGELPISIVLAQREQHTFAYNDEHTEYGEYKSDIDVLTSNISKELKDLKKIYNNLVKEEKLIKQFKKAEKIKEILDELCLPLRHLVKDIAFKEEQECRCIKLSALTNPQVKEEIKHKGTINEKTHYYIENNSIASAVTKIWIGPQCASLPAIQELVARNDLDIKVEQSQLPIRD